MICIYYEYYLFRHFQFLPSHTPVNVGHLPSYTGLPSGKLGLTAIR